MDQAKDAVLDLQRAYEEVFNPESRAVQMVLEDLTIFCRGAEPTFDPDPRLHALLEGRREVFLRISRYLNLSSDALWEYFARKKGLNNVR